MEIDFSINFWEYFTETKSYKIVKFRNKKSSHLLVLTPPKLRNFYKNGRPGKGITFQTVSFIGNILNTFKILDDQIVVSKRCHNGQIRRSGYRVTLMLMKMHQLALLTISPVGQ